MWLLHMMKHAAHQRHGALVRFWYSPGPARWAAYERHRDIVEAVYNMFGV